MAFRPLNPALAVAAVLAIGAALWQLYQAQGDVTVSPLDIGGAPARIYRTAGVAASPVVVIAHGFAGSQQLMQPFAVTLARNGYTAVTFDFAGHGRNASSLTGSITEAQGATQTLVRETARVIDVSRGLGDGRLAILGHSMASDIIIRAAQADRTVKAVVAVSMFSPVVTASSPANLLVIVGDWEGMLKQEALRVVGLVSAPAMPLPGVTYGSFANGTARRAAFSPHSEHVSVLYSQNSMGEALAWLDQTFGMPRAATPHLDARGPWIMLLLAGVVLLARPLSMLLPIVSRPAVGAALHWRQLWPALLVPALVTPLILRVLPTHFLPILVGDYLAAHFAMYGLLTAACIRLSGKAQPARLPVPTGALATAAVAAMLFGFVCIVWPIDIHVTSFVPGPARLALMAAMLAGTLPFFLSDEWLTRGVDDAGRPAAWGAYGATKLAFLMSLGLAVALDFQRLFFLLIIVPVIVIFFIVYGLFSAWMYRRTGHPFVAAIANAVAFAWAIAVTFPLLAG
jgi:pimeloyl-ACP methyl ester carboxylesterase